MFDDLTKNQCCPEIGLDPQDCCLGFLSGIDKRSTHPANSKTNDLGDEEIDRFEDTAVFNVWDSKLDSK